LKILGIGWLKRKALKASLALMPESQKAKYEVKGNKVIVIDEDRDTLTLGNDGNTLSGIFDKETKYTLKRTK
jgi:5'-3' exonuclease